MAGNNDDIVYNEYLQLLNTEHSEVAVPRNATLLDTDSSISYEIVYRDINSTNQSHYLEFEYDIYMHQESTDYTIAMCGLRIQTTDDQIYCWAETYMLIRYNPGPAEENMTKTPPPTTSIVCTTATSTVTVSIYTPMPTMCPIPPSPTAEPYTIPVISSGMAIASLIAVIELIAILLLVKWVCGHRANDFTHPGEIHANEAREDKE